MEIMEKTYRQVAGAVAKLPDSPKPSFPTSSPLNNRSKVLSVSTAMSSGETCISSAVDSIGESAVEVTQENKGFLQSLVSWFDGGKALKPVADRINGETTDEITQKVVECVADKNVDKVTNRKKKAGEKTDEELLSDRENILHGWLEAGSSVVLDCTLLKRLEDMKRTCIGTDVNTAHKVCKSMMAPSSIQKNKDNTSLSNLLYANISPIADSNSLKSLGSGFDLITSAAETNAGQPTRYAISLSLLRFVTILEMIAYNMMKSACEASTSPSFSVEEYSNFEKKKNEEWQNSIASIRKSIENSSKLKKASGVSISLMLLELVKMDIILIALPDPFMASKAINALGNLVMGTAKAVMTMSFNEQILKGFKQGLDVGVGVLRRNAASSVADAFICFERITSFARFRLGLPRGEKYYSANKNYDNDDDKEQTVEYDNSYKDIVYLIMSAQEEYIVRDATMRWEIRAAYTVMLTDVCILMSDKIKDLVSEFADDHVHMFKKGSARHNKSQFDKQVSDAILTAINEIMFYCDDSKTMKGAGGGGGSGRSGGDGLRSPVDTSTHHEGNLMNKSPAKTVDSGRVGDKPSSSGTTRSLLGNRKMRMPTFSSSFSKGGLGSEGSGKREPKLESMPDSVYIRFSKDGSGGGSSDEEYSFMIPTEIMTEIRALHGIIWLLIEGSYTHAIPPRADAESKAAATEEVGSSHDGEKLLKNNKSKFSDVKTKLLTTDALTLFKKIDDSDKMLYLEHSLDSFLAYGDISNVNSVSIDDPSSKLFGWAQSLMTDALLGDQFSLSNFIEQGYCILWDESAFMVFKAKEVMDKFDVYLEEAVGVIVKITDMNLSAQNLKVANESLALASSSVAKCIEALPSAIEFLQNAKNLSRRALSVVEKLTSLCSPVLMAFSIVSSNKLYDYYQTFYDLLCPPTSDQIELMDTIEAAGSWMTSAILDIKNWFLSLAIHLTYDTDIDRNAVKNEFQLTMTAQSGGGGGRGADSEVDVKVNCRDIIEMLDDFGGKVTTYLDSIKDKKRRSEQFKKNKKEGFENLMKEVFELKMESVWIKNFRAEGEGGGGGGGGGGGSSAELDGGFGPRNYASVKYWLRLQEYYEMEMEGKERGLNDLNEAAVKKLIEDKGVVLTMPFLVYFQPKNDSKWGSCLEQLSKLQDINESGQHGNTIHGFFGKMMKILGSFELPLKISDDNNNAAVRAVYNFQSNLTLFSEIINKSLVQMLNYKDALEKIYKGVGSISSKLSKLASSVADGANSSNKSSKSRFMDSLSPIFSSIAASTSGVGGNISSTDEVKALSLLVASNILDPLSVIFSHIPKLLEIINDSDSFLFNRRYIGKKVKIQIDEFWILMKKKMGLNVQKLQKQFGSTLDILKEKTITSLESALNKALPSASEALQGSFDVGDCSGLLASLGGGISDLVKARSSTQQIWRVRDVAALCARRIAIGISSKKLIKHILVILNRRKTFESNYLVRSTLDGGDSKQLESLNNIFCSIADISHEPAEVTSEEKEIWLEQEEAIFQDITYRIQALNIEREAADNEADPLKKQEIIYRCKVEQAALVIVSRNVKDIGKKLDIIVGFLGNIQGQLASIDGKLNMIQADISALKNDVQRLVGRDPRDIVRDWSKALVKGMSRENVTAVYIEPEVCGPGPKQDFIANKVSNKPISVTKAFKTFMNDDTSVMLLSGMAGSGKSTAIKKLREYILSEYTYERSQEGKKVVLLEISLPTLKDPLSSLFLEGSKLAYNRALSSNQIHELAGFIKNKDSDLELVLFLDAYDELRPEFLWKNLYLSNNLEQYHQDPESVAASKKTKKPKVLITTRSEILEGKEASTRLDGGTNLKRYVASFVPREIAKRNPQDPDKAKVEDAYCFLSEYRFIPFDDKRIEFQSQFVAIKWRALFVKQLQANIINSYPERKIEVDKAEFTSSVNEMCRAICNLRLIKDVKETTYLVTTFLSSLYKISTVKPAFVRSLNEENKSSSSQPLRSGRRRGVRVGGANTVMTEGERLVFWFTKYLCSALYDSYQAELKTIISVDALLKQSKITEKKLKESSIEYKCLEMGCPPINQVFLLMTASFLGAIFFEETAKDEKSSTGISSAVNSGETNSAKVSLILDFVKKQGQVPQDKRLWTLNDYNEQFIRIPELKDLSSTPFMIEVVTEILPTLQGMRQSNNEVKSALILIFGEFSTETIWALLQRRDVLESTEAATQKLPIDYKPVAQGKVMRWRSITKGLVNVRSGCKHDAPVAYTIKCGDTVDVVGTCMYRGSKEGFTSIAEQAHLVDGNWTTLSDDYPLFEFVSETARSGGGMLGNLLSIQANLELGYKSLSDPNYRETIAKVTFVATKAAQELFPKLKAVPPEIPLECPERMRAQGGSEEQFIEFISYGIEQALKRQPTRRSLIYEAFTNVLIEREVEKALASRSTIAPNKLSLEAKAYARNLAHYLTFEGITKLAERNVSELFSKKSYVDTFFVESELAVAARRAAPVRISAGFLSFIHKTVQEFYIAQVMISEVQEAVQETNISEELLKDIKDVKELKLKEEQLESSINTDGLVKIKMDSSKKELSSRDQKELDECLEYLQSGSIGKIDLREEYAVIDFIADFILSNNEATAALEYCHDLLVFKFRDDSNESNGRNDYLSNIFVKNLFEIFTTRLPRRNYQTILHLAAYDGMENLLYLALHVIQRFVLMSNQGREKFMKVSDFIDIPDTDNKTPFYRALEGRHSVICEILLRNGSNPLIKANSDIIVKLLDGVDAGTNKLVINFDQVEQPRFDWSRFKYMGGLLKLDADDIDKSETDKNAFFTKKAVVGCPMTILDLNAKKKGIYVYEVEVEETTIGHELYIGWTTSEQANMATSKSGYKDLSKVKHIGFDGRSVSFSRGTRIVNFSKVCCDRGHMLRFESSQKEFRCKSKLAQEALSCLNHPCPNSNPDHDPHFNRSVVANQEKEVRKKASEVSFCFNYKGGATNENQKGKNINYGRYYCVSCDYNICESCHSLTQGTSFLGPDPCYNGNMQAPQFIPEFWGGKDRILDCDNLFSYERYVDHEKQDKTLNVQHEIKDGLNDANVDQTSLLFTKQAVSSSRFPSIHIMHSSESKYNYSGVYDPTSASSMSMSYPIYKSRVKYLHQLNDAKTRGGSPLPAEHIYLVAKQCMESRRFAWILCTEATKNESLIFTKSGYSNSLAAAENQKIKKKDFFGDDESSIIGATVLAYGPAAYGKVPKLIPNSDETFEYGEYIHEIVKASDEVVTTFKCSSGKDETKKMRIPSKLVYSIHSDKCIKLVDQHQKDKNQKETNQKVLLEEILGEQPLYDPLYSDVSSYYNGFCVYQKRGNSHVKLRYERSGIVNGWAVISTDKVLTTPVEKGSNPQPFEYTTKRNILSARDKIEPFPKTNPPNYEGCKNVLDGNTDTKYVHCDKLNSGFVVTPLDGSSVINGISLTTAKDCPECDPESYKVEGSNDSGAKFEVIATGKIPITAERDNARCYYFENSKSFSIYRVTFPTVANVQTANAMQIGAVGLLVLYNVLAFVDNVNNDNVVCLPEHIPYSYEWKLGDAIVSQQNKLVKVEESANKEKKERKQGSAAGGGENIAEKDVVENKIDDVINVEKTVTKDALSKLFLRVKVLGSVKRDRVTITGVSGDLADKVNGTYIPCESEFFGISRFVKLSGAYSFDSSENKFKYASQLSPSGGDAAVFCPKRHIIMPASSDNAISWNCCAKNEPGGCRRDVENYSSLSSEAGGGGIVARFRCDVCNADYCGQCFKAKQEVGMECKFIKNSGKKVEKCNDCEKTKDLSWEILIKNKSCYLCDSCFNRNATFLEYIHGHNAKKVQGGGVEMGSETMFAGVWCVVGVIEKVKVVGVNNEKVKIQPFQTLFMYVDLIELADLSEDEKHNLFFRQSRFPDKFPSTSFWISPTAAAAGLGGSSFDNLRSPYSNRADFLTEFFKLINSSSMNLITSTTGLPFKLEPSIKLRLSNEVDDFHFFYNENNKINGFTEGGSHISGASKCLFEYDSINTHIAHIGYFGDEDAAPIFMKNYSGHAKKVKPAPTKLVIGTAVIISEIWNEKKDAIEGYDSEILFGLDGDWSFRMSKEDCNKLLASQEKLFPAVSFSGGEIILRFNFGEEDFKYPFILPPTSSPAARVLSYSKSNHAEQLSIIPVGKLVCGRSPLLIAASNGNKRIFTSIIQYLSRRRKLLEDKIESEEKTSSSSQSVELISRLRSELEAFRIDLADIDRVTNDFILHFLVRYKVAEGVKDLCGRTRIANYVNAVNSKGETPLWVLLCSLLVNDKGIYYYEDNINDANRGRPSHCQSDIDIAIGLIESDGFDPLVPSPDDYFGCSYLMAAIKLELHEIVELLMKYSSVKSDINRTDKQGKSAISYCIDSSNPNKLKLMKLIFEGASEYLSINEARIYNSGSSYGGGRVEEGFEPLLVYAVLDEGLFNMITGQKALFRQDNTNPGVMTSKYGTTPLIRAVQHGKLEFVKRILNMDRYNNIDNVNLTDFEGRSALVYAEMALANCLGQQCHRTDISVLCLNRHAMKPIDASKCSFGPCRNCFKGLACNYCKVNLRWVNTSEAIPAADSNTDFDDGTYTCSLCSQTKVGNHFTCNCNYYYCSACIFTQTAESVISNFDVGVGEKMEWFACIAGKDCCSDSILCSICHSNKLQVNEALQCTAKTREEIVLALLSDSSIKLNGVNELKYNRGDYIMAKSKTSEVKGKFRFKNCSCCELEFTEDLPRLFEHRKNALPHTSLNDKVFCRFHHNLTKKVLMMAIYPADQSPACFRCNNNIAGKNEEYYSCEKRECEDFLLCKLCYELSLIGRNICLSCSDNDSILSVASFSGHKLVVKELLSLDFSSIINAQDKDGYTAALRTAIKIASTASDSHTGSYNCCRGCIVPYTKKGWKCPKCPLELNADSIHLYNIKKYCNYCKKDASAIYKCDCGYKCCVFCLKMQKQRLYACYYCKKLKPSSYICKRSEWKFEFGCGFAYCDDCVKKTRRAFRSDSLKVDLKAIFGLLISKKGIDLNLRRGEDGFNVLIYLVSKGRLDMIEQIFKEGDSLLDINARDNEGKTAIFHAVDKYISLKKRVDAKRFSKYDVNSSIGLGCMSCSKSLESNLAEGDYNRGFVCNLCRCSFGKGSYRYFCKTCSNDYCRSCYKKSIATNASEHFKLAPSNLPISEQHFICHNKRFGSCCGVGSVRVGYLNLFHDDDSFEIHDEKFDFFTKGDSRRLICEDCFNRRLKAHYDSQAQLMDSYEKIISLLLSQKGIDLNIQRIVDGTNILMLCMDSGCKVLLTVILDRATNAKLSVPLNLYLEDARGCTVLTRLLKSLQTVCSQEPRKYYNCSCLCSDVSTFRRKVIPAFTNFLCLCVRSPDGHKCRSGFDGSPIGETPAAATTATAVYMCDCVGDSPIKFGYCADCFKAMSENSASGFEKLLTNQLDIWETIIHKLKYDVSTQTLCSKPLLLSFAETKSPKVKCCKKGCQLYPSVDLIVQVGEKYDVTNKVKYLQKCANEFEVVSTAAVTDKKNIFDLYRSARRRADAVEKLVSEGRKGENITYFRYPTSTDAVCDNGHSCMMTETTEEDAWSCDRCWKGQADFEEENDDDEKEGNGGKRSLIRWNCADCNYNCCFSCHPKRCCKISIGTTEALGLANRSFSIMCWIYIPSFAERDGDEKEKDHAIIGQYHNPASMDISICCPSGHKLKASSGHYYNCDAMREVGGCKSNNKIVGKARWQCLDCDFDYCGPCYDMKMSSKAVVPHETLHLLVRSRRLYFGFHEDNTEGRLILDECTWYHVCFSFDVATGTQSIYLNGELDASTKGHKPLQGNHEVLLMQYLDLDKSKFEGDICDLKIVPKAMKSEEEVIDHMANHSEFVDKKKYDAALVHSPDDRKDKLIALFDRSYLVACDEVFGDMQPNVMKSLWINCRDKNKKDSGITTSHQIRENSMKSWAEIGFSNDVVVDSAYYSNVNYLFCSLCDDSLDKVSRKWSCVACQTVYCSCVDVLNAKFTDVYMQLFDILSKKSSNFDVNLRREDIITLPESKQKINFFRKYLKSASGEEGFGYKDSLCISGLKGSALEHPTTNSSSGGGIIDACYFDPLEGNLSLYTMRGNPEVTLRCDPREFNASSCVLHVGKKEIRQPFAGATTGVVVVSNGYNMAVNDVLKNVRIVNAMYLCCADPALAPSIADRMFTSGTLVDPRILAIVNKSFDEFKSGRSSCPKGLASSIEDALVYHWRLDTTRFGSAEDDSSKYSYSKELESSRLWIQFAVGPHYKVIVDFPRDNAGVGTAGDNKSWEDVIIDLFRQYMIAMHSFVIPPSQYTLKASCIEKPANLDSLSMPGSKEEISLQLDKYIEIGGNASNSNSEVSIRYLFDIDFNLSRGSIFRYVSGFGITGIRKHQCENGYMLHDIGLKGVEVQDECAESYVEQLLAKYNEPKSFNNNYYTINSSVEFASIVPASLVSCGDDYENSWMWFRSACDPYSVAPIPGSNDRNNIIIDNNNNKKHLSLTPYSSVRFTGVASKGISKPAFGHILLKAVPCDLSNELFVLSRNNIHLGSTALMRAVSCTNLELVKLLIQVPGVDINARDEGGKNALFYSICRLAQLSKAAPILSKIHTLYMQQEEIVSCLMSVKGLDIRDAIDNTDISFTPDGSVDLAAWTAKHDAWWEYFNTFGRFNTASMNVSHVSDDDN